MTESKNRIGVGVDFGTSNSALAWYDGEKLHLVKLELSGEIMPTATHLDRDFTVLTGADAVEQYIEENRDRIVELTPEVIGKSSLLVGAADPASTDSQGETITSNIYGKAVNDRGMPGRLFRGVKRLLGNSSLNRLLVFERPFRLVALITPILLRMRQSIESELKTTITRAHVGYPINFEGSDPYRNKLAMSRLAESYGHAGFEEIEFYPEPLAATLSFFADEPHHPRGVVLAFDFGGGTLDLSMVKYNGMEFDVLSTRGLSLGGDHIDQLIFRHLLFPLLGKGEIWSRKVDGQVIENFFPFEEFEEGLLNWAVTYTLNQNRYRSKIADCIAQSGKASEKFERLNDLIKHNYSYIVFQSIKDAKAELSTRESCFIDIPELDLSIPFSRQQLDDMMSEMLNDIRTLIDEVLEDATISADSVDLVIRTGGSSQIVAVREILDQRFPGKVTEHYPFTSVAAGLALASYHNHHFNKGVGAAGAPPDS
jgi:hypothetical chaperone protein